MLPSSSLPASQHPTKRRKLVQKVGLSGLGVCDSILSRELSSLRSQCKPIGTKLNFHNLRLQKRVCCYDTLEKVGAASPMRYGGLFRRSKITEIIPARNYLFSLSDAGYCAAFTRPDLEQVCTLNISEDESIRSLFFNKSADSIVTVSVWRQDRYSVLKCRSIPLRDIWDKSPRLAGSDIFVGESLRFPGFVEFDDTNDIVVTYAASQRVFKFWRLLDYEFRFEICDPTVQEVKLSAGMALLVHSKFGGQLPLSLISLSDGSVLKSFHHSLHRHTQLDLMEQFDSKVIFKQRNRNIQILDVSTLSTVEVTSTEAAAAQAFVFMHGAKVFLTRQDRVCTVFDFRGKQISCFPDPSANGGLLFAIGSHQQLVAHQRNSHAGCLKLFDMMTGNCICTVAGASGSEVSALDDVTALHYDEDQGELFTGSADGRVYLWSN